MTDEELGLVDSVTETTNGIGSEALAAISNLGGDSGSIAADVVGRLAATVSDRSGGFAPKVITTITKHGIAGIQRVEPIQGVDRGYRAVAKDANGLESIRTVLDLDPREYDVTVTREAGAGVVEFVQQEPETSEATELPEGDEPSTSSASADTRRHARAPVKETTVEDRRAEAVDNSEESRRVIDSGKEHAPAVETNKFGENATEVERVRAEAEKAKAEAEAEKARSEAERARAEAEAAKARADAERAKAQAETEAIESRRDGPVVEDRQLRKVDAEPESESVAASDSGAASDSAPDGPAFSSGTSVDAGFNPSEPTTTDHRSAGDWGGRHEPRNSESTEADTGFGEFTAARPVSGSDQGETVADGGTGEKPRAAGGGEESRAEDGGGDEGVAVDGTGEFIF